MKSETEVRHWLRGLAGLGCRVEWVEAGRGGTEGHPDALVHLPGGERTIPVECKLWSHAKRSPEFITKLRPVQVRYHHRADMEGRQTVILWGVTGKSRVLWAIGNQRCPMAASDRLPTVHAWCYDHGEIADFLSDLVSGRMWEDCAGSALGCIPRAEPAVQP